MDIVLMIVYATLILGFLVFIHEGGHYLAARAFGVRVTEFMLGLPGPNIGFTKWGTKFGVTPFLLGGYAKVCGMEPGEMSPHLEPVLAALYRRGTANMEDELVEWGSIAGPTKQDKYNTYRAPVVKPSKKQVAAGAVAYELGQARPVEDAHALFESEYKQQYRSLPFWKRSVILVAGVVVNLLFAVLLFVVLFSLIGVDVQTSAGDIRHVNVNPLDAIRMGFMYIGMVVQLIAGLFNPWTAGEVVQNSTSVIGIAAMSKQAVDLGLASAISFVASISVSLGIMNLLPIPPLDGGRFVIEVFQKISRKVVTMRALNYLSAAGMILFIGFFLFMANQDIQRIISGAGFGG